MNSINNDFLKISVLIVLQKAGKLSISQRTELDNWLSANPAFNPFLETLNDPDHIRVELERMNRFDTEISLKKLHHKYSQKKTLKLWHQIIGVAAILACIIIGVYLYRLNTANNARQQLYANDIKPGSNKATLTLSSGKIIELNDSKTGVVIDSRKLSYNDGTVITPMSTSPDNDQITAATPRGGTYQVFLPDGTHVWLNAESTLKFPAKFSTSNRSVTLTGEAYFEVSKDKTRPFVVTSGQHQVEVLGTHFNINAYADETDIRTTLLEGRVKVNQDIILKPNEQSIVNGKNIRVIPVIASSFTDWKDNKFYFKNERLSSVMRKLARWYDVDIEFQTNLDNLGTFSGTTSKYDNLSKVLILMEQSEGLHFNIEGRKVIVSK